MEAGSTAVNAPHADDPNPDDFFGGDEGAAETDAAAAAQAEQAAAADAAAAEPAPDAPEPEVGPANPDAPPVEAQPAESPAPPPADPPPAAPGDGDGGGDGDGESPKSSGSQERPYVVLRELTLTPDVLKKLLEDAENTQAGEYRKGYFVLEESLEARNVKHALGAAFNKHNERIGQKPRLVALTHRSWQPKTVAPKQRTVESLDIS